MQHYYPQAEHFILDERVVERPFFLRLMPLLWLRQTILPKAGISQEIFRNGIYTFSLGPSFKGSYPVRKGDDIYSISLLPYVYSFTGIMVTKDRKQQGYDMHLELRVINPTRFMEIYHNGQDPAYGVFTEFKQSFEYYTSKMEDGTEARIGPWLDKQVAVLSQTYGIQIMHPTWFFHALHENMKEVAKQESIEQFALRRRRELETDYSLKAYEERLKRGLEREQKEFQREEKAKNNDFARSEIKKKKVLEEQIRLLSSTVNSLIQMNNDRVNDNIGYIPPEVILKGSLKLLAGLNNSLDSSAQEAEAIIDTMLSNNPLSVEDEKDYEPDTVVDPPSSPSVGTNNVDGNNKSRAGQG